MERHPLDWNAKLIRFFVSNSRLVWLLIIFILVGGFFSLISLRREGFPEVAPKIVLVQTVYPGAAAQEVDSQVTRVIEGGVKDVKGLKEVSSTSQNSFSNVVVTLDESVDSDQAIQDVQSKVQAVRASLPTDAEQPKVATFSTSGPAFLFGITQEGKSLGEIKDATKKLVDNLADTAGVKSAEVLHESGQRVVVAYRLTDLERLGISPATLSQILQGSSVNFPVGTLDVDGKSQTVVSAGAFTSLDDIRNVAVGVNPATGQPILLKDVAEVRSEAGSEEVIDRFAYTKEGRLAHVSGTLVTVSVTSAADIITTKETIDKEIQQLKDDGVVAKDLQVITLSDQAESTQEQVTEIIEAAVGAEKNFWLLGGIQLLFLAILLFVNVQAAIIAALAIPLSLGITFIFLALTGIQLNTIVLFSFILVLGLIVDPAIVMVEAIQRYRELRYSPRDAVVESGRRYGASLFMAVLTSLIVFFPFGVVSGIFGEIIKYIPLTVVPALVASYFVPVALLPLLTERFIKPGKRKEISSSESEGLSGAARAVMAINRWVLERFVRQVLILLLALELVVMSLLLVVFGKVQVVQFSTPEDNELVGVSANLASGLTFSDRNALGQQIEDVIKKEAAVKEFFYQDQSKESLSLMVHLKDRAERSDAQQKSKAVVNRLRPEVEKIKGITDVTVEEFGVGPPTSAYPIQTQLYANDPVVLEKAAKDVGAALKKIEHVTRVDDGFTDRGEPQLRIVLDRAKVQARGLSSFEIGQQLRNLVDETKVTSFEPGGSSTSTDVYLVSASLPTKTDDIRNLPLLSRTGSALTLGEVASVEQTTSVDAIQRINGSRFVNVRAKVDDAKNTFAVQTALDDYLTDDKIKELGLESRKNRGEFEDIAKSFTELGVALAVAVLLTYIALVLQFKSFSQPAIILATIPLSLIGVFPALQATGSDLGFLELLGVTILVGIVENVAIFLIDYANQLTREQDVPVKEAIIQASGVRFRPILLTKLVAVGGLLPLAIESEFWRGLSVVIIAGIGLSGFFSLVVIPILYVWLEKGRKWIHRPRRATHLPPPVVASQPGINQ